MKILFLDHGKTYGGGQVMAARLLPLLRARGYEIEAWTGCEDLEGHPIPRTHMGLRRAIRSGDHDLIYANTPRVAIAAMLSKRPFVWHKHNPRITWVQRRVTRRARRVISVCRFGAPDGENVRVVYNGVPAMVAEPAGDLPEGRKVLMLGRMHEEKGHDVAEAAVSAMQTPATLVAAGPGAPLGLRHDVAALLAACDALVLPSRCDEGCPLAVLEAQAAGLPVVATRSGGVVEIIRDESLLVEKEDPVATAAALDRALAMGRTEVDTRFDIERCADEVAAVLEECREAVGV